MPLPFPELASEKLILRAWSRADVDVLVRACNDPELRARLGVPAPYTELDAREYVALCAAGWAAGDQFRFAALDRATDDVVGSVRVGRSPGGATAGYWTVPWARRQGVASGGLRLVTQWASSADLGPIRLYVAPDNIASQRVALNASYRLDASGAIRDPEGETGDFVYVR